MSDNRREPRQKTMLQAEIATPEGFVMSCSVRDLTEHGARLSFGNAFWVPDRFELRIPLRGWIAHGEVRWRRGNQVGIQFLVLRRVPVAGALAAKGLPGATRMLPPHQAPRRLRPISP
jgi:hypothetical protein